MDKKSNMKQAMFEMFGVGSDQTEVAEQDVFVETFTPVEVKRTSASKKAAGTYIAPGTVLEGTLRTEGDVEIAGDFKGDITATGTVVLRASIQGNVTASNLRLHDCNLQGDVAVTDAVSVSQYSTLCGNVTAKDVRCAGQITGDLKVAENTEVESTAKINGNISTGTIVVLKGAVIRGGIEIKSAE